MELMFQKSSGKVPSSKQVPENSQVPKDSEKVPSFKNGDFSGIFLKHKFHDHLYYNILRKIN